MQNADRSIAETRNGNDDELRKERKRRRAERRRKKANAQRVKGSRGGLHRVPAVELTPREQEVSRRWSA